MKKLFMFTLICLGLASCGKDASVWPTAQAKAESVDPATSEEFTYEFSGRRCTTGMQSAKTFGEICEVLTDDQLNAGCAQDKREELFYSAQCPGSFI